MKKILFATTVLVATASMAAAEVRISGYGRFGLDYNDFNARTGLNGAGVAANGVSETNITSRLRLQFDMSTETDGGVTLGARFRAQAESRDNAPGGAIFNGARFYATYGGFTLGVGNIIGAFENASGLYLETRTAGTGIDGQGFVDNVANVSNEAFNWDAYSSAGAGVNGFEVLYSAGAFQGHISYSTTNGAPAAQVDRVAVNVAYTFGDWTVALAAQDSDRLFEDKTFASVQGKIGAFGVRLAYADNEGIGKLGLYGNMDIGAASNILVWVTSEDDVSAADIAAGRANNTTTIAAGGTGSAGTSYGIHYSYDLGGGASFEAGLSEHANDQTQVQAGVYFSF